MVSTVIYILVLLIYGTFLKMFLNKYFEKLFYNNDYSYIYTSLIYVMLWRSIKCLRYSPCTINVGKI
jgi:hypothetical protein